MKRFLPALALTVLATATPMFALDPPQGDERPASRDHDRTTVIDDVIKMSKAGVDDDAIIKFVLQSRNLYVVDADVIIALTDAKVSKPVLEAVMDEAYDRGSGRAERRDDRRRTRTVYVHPYGYSPWFSPYAYDPFWYGPRVSFGFGFGGHHRGWYRGHRGRLH